MEWPKQDTKGVLCLSEALRAAVQADRLLVEVDGNLVVIQIRNVKYVKLLPVPDRLPEGVIRNARYAAQLASSVAKLSPAA